MEYSTDAFKHAAALTPEEQVRFLSELPDNRFYNPSDVDPLFADITRFCLLFSKRTRFTFAAMLSVSSKQIMSWQRQEELPFPPQRKPIAKEMIKIALDHWQHPELPRPPGSNIHQLTPRQ